MTLERKTSAFVAWSVEREVSLHAYLYTSGSQTTGST